MRVNRLVLVGFVLLLGISACKKYSDGPFFSLRARTKRVANEWVVQSAVNAQGTDVSDEFERWRIELNEELEYNMDFVSKSGIFYEIHGNWSWANSDSEIRISSTNDSLDTRFGENIEILKLTKNEFWIKSKVTDEEVKLRPKEVGKEAKQYNI